MAHASRTPWPVADRIARNSTAARIAVAAVASPPMERNLQNPLCERRKNSAAPVAGIAATPATPRNSRLSPKAYIPPYACRSGPLVDAK
jgi:hypothetical protein